MIDQEKRPSDMSSEDLIWDLYQTYARLMHFTAKKYISDPHLCEDVVQDSLARLIQKTDTLRRLESSALTGYIVTTVRNTAINLLKKHDPYQAIELDQAEESGALQAASAEEEVLRRERLGRLTKVWDRLDEETKQVLEGKYILGLSDGELALLLGCKPSSVRMKLTRARRRALALMRGDDQCDEA